jgi:DNA helicase TIP49 (TBP-interacting protein)
MSRKKETNQQGRSVLLQIRKIKPFIQGSVTETLKKCGNPKCQCATQGPIHKTILLTWKEGKKTKTLHVPQHMKDEVTAWVEEGKKLKQLIAQMSAAQRAFLTEKRKKK